MAATIGIHLRGKGRELGCRKKAVGWPSQRPYCAHCHVQLLSQTATSAHQLNSAQRRSHDCKMAKDKVRGNDQTTGILNALGRSSATQAAQRTAPRSQNNPLTRGWADRVSSCMSEQGTIKLGARRQHYPCTWHKQGHH